MAMIPGFCKLFTLGDRNIQNIFDGEVEITEKIDGSQFNFGVVNGELKMRSKNAEVFVGDGNKMFNKAKEFAKGCFDKGLLPDDWIFHGEYIQSPRHNTLEYGRVPKNNFMLFGISTHEGPISRYTALASWAQVLDCEVVPVLYAGSGDLPVDLKELLKRESVLGTAQIEGIVVKNYGKQVVLGGGQVIHPIMCGKFVSEQFKEKHAVAWGESNPGPIEAIAKAFEAKARWDKAIQHNRDANLLTYSPKDIGPLLKYINQDIEEEEVENLKDLLWKTFRKDILRLATKGFPEYYKNKLLESAVGG